MARRVAMWQERRLARQGITVEAGELLGVCWEAGRRAAETWRPDGGASLQTHVERRMAGAVRDWLREEVDPASRQWRRAIREGRAPDPARAMRLDKLVDLGEDRPFRRELVCQASERDREALGAGEEVERRLRGLTPAEREAVLLYYRDDWTMAQIAAASGVCESRISQVLDRAVLWLRERPVSEHCRVCGKRFFPLDVDDDLCRDCRRELGKPFVLRDAEDEDDPEEEAETVHQAEARGKAERLEELRAKAARGEPLTTPAAPAAPYIRSEGVADTDSKAEGPSKGLRAGGRTKADEECRVPECVNKAVTRGLCNKHQAQRSNPAVAKWMLPDGRSHGKAEGGRRKAETTTATASPRKAAAERPAPIAAAGDGKMITIQLSREDVRGLLALRRTALVAACSVLSESNEAEESQAVEAVMVAASRLAALRSELPAEAGEE
jgi:RNA polymerase sigma factor (sigma-70 family)